MINTAQKITQNNFCWIHLNNIKTFIYLGANEHEEKIGQNITLNLSLKLRYTNTDDELLNTVDYGKVCEFILHKIQASKKIKLLEYLAEQLINEIESNFSGIYAVKLSIEKGYVPLKNFTGNVVIEVQKDFLTS